MFHDSQFANLTGDQKTRLRRLAWSAFAKLVVSAAAAVGTKFGEKAVEWVLGDDEDDDEEPSE
jgi:phosphoribosyl-ATP pyrophosphohydrolase